MSECFIGEIRNVGFSWAPVNWNICDGTVLDVAPNEALYSLLGTTFGGNGATTFGIPDLRGRFPVSVGQGPGLTNRAWGANGGTEEVTLVESNIPAHSHTLAANNGTATANDPTGAIPAKPNVPSNMYYSKTDKTASGLFDDASIGANPSGNYPHDNMPPFVVTNFIVATNGIYPQADGGQALGDAMLGEIRMGAFNFAPGGWHLCDGSLLQIAQNQALYSLLGTYFGGDGVKTFGLPDLRGRIPFNVDARTAPFAKGGLAGGSETVALTAAQTPPHNHPLFGLDIEGTKQNPNGLAFANPAIKSPVSTDAVYTTNAPNTTFQPTTIGNAGAGQAHQNMAPFLAVNFIICTLGLYPMRN